MKSVGAYEAKTHLSQLLDEVARGETITITRHGVPVAQLVPPATDQREKLDIDAAIAQFRELRKGISLDGLSIRDLVEEGRR